MCQMKSQNNFFLQYYMYTIFSEINLIQNMLWGNLCHKDHNFTRVILF